MTCWACSRLHGTDEFSEENTGIVVSERLIENQGGCLYLTKPPCVHSDLFPKNEIPEIGSIFKNS